MNRRFFSEFLAVLSRRVDPRRDMSPSSEDVRHDRSPLAGEDADGPRNEADFGGKQRKKTMTRETEVNGSSLSLHSQAVDLCYEA